MLRASWRIALVPSGDPADPPAFVMAESLEVTRLEGEGIRGWREEPFPAVPIWKLVVLELDEDRPDGPLEVEIDYAGRPWFEESGINRIAEDWVELSVDSGWHPLPAAFDQEMRGVLRVALPEGWEVVGGSGARYVDGFHVLRFDEPQLDVAWAAAPQLERAEGERLTVLHRGGDPETVRLVLERAESCADYLDARYGRDDPLPMGTLLMADRPASGYARLGHIVLTHVDPDHQSDLARFLCHELAHYWSRGQDFTSVHHWMSEAFAEYVGARYVRERVGREAFDSLIAHWDEAGRDAGPVWSEEMTERGSFAVMYRRAPVLLARLEERIGEEAFDRFLERYMTREVATTPELLQALEEVAGREAAEDFRAMLAEGPGG